MGDYDCLPGVGRVLLWVIMIVCLESEEAFCGNYDCLPRVGRGLLWMIMIVCLESEEAFCG